MPQFGEAHKLLSATHLDTEPPAGGADPSDGQIPTWSDALKSWTAQDPAPGGVTDHGLLTGLSDDDHSIYALLAGRSGGQTLIGGSAASEHLTLQSTAHATRGYVRAQDDLQLLSNILRDSGGNNRLQLATASPHLTASGELKVTDRMAIGRNPDSATWLYVEPSGQVLTNKILARIQCQASQLGSGSFRALMGVVPAVLQSGATGTMHGLEFASVVSGGGGGASVTMRANYLQNQYVSYTGTISELVTYRSRAPVSFGGTPSVTVSRGLHLENAGGYSSIVDVESIKVDDISANTGHRYLIDLGPATPYFRVVGGAAPAAGLSNMYLNVGGTLYHVRTRTIGGFDCLTIN